MALGHMGHVQVLRGDRKAQVMVTCGGGEALPPRTCITPALWHSGTQNHPSLWVPLTARHA